MADIKLAPRRGYHPRFSIPDPRPSVREAPAEQTKKPRSKKRRPKKEKKQKKPIDRIEPTPTRSKTLPYLAAVGAILIAVVTLEQPVRHTLLPVVFDYLSPPAAQPPLPPAAKPPTPPARQPWRIGADPELTAILSTHSKQSTTEMTFDKRFAAFDKYFQSLSAPIKRDLFPDFQPTRIRDIATTTPDLARSVLDRVALRLRFLLLIDEPHK